MKILSKQKRTVMSEIPHQIELQFLCIASQSEKVMLKDLGMHDSETLLAKCQVISSSSGSDTATA